MSRFAIVFVVLSWTCQAQAQLPPDGDKPYNLRVILHFSPHRALTAVFRDQVQRELRDSLQAALGALAHVEVIRDHPLLKEVTAEGLRQAPSGWHFVSDEKLHFILIDYVAGRYEIQARQYDGLTGLPSPVVRKVTTADRQLVAREAGLLIDRDFGVVGTVTPSEGEKVEVALHGGELGVSLIPWVKKDDIFVIAQIVSQGGGGMRSYQVPSALLQVLNDPREGHCACQLFHRYKNPLAGGSGILGYRCMKLGTVTASLRLRMVQEDRFGAPASGLRVQISQNGEGAVMEQRSSNFDGFVRSEKKYRNMAIVKVFSGGLPVAQLPVEIVDEHTIAIPVSASPEAEPRGMYYLRRNHWIQRVYDSIEVAATVVRELNVLSQESREKALAKAQAGLRSLKDDLESLSSEREALRKEAEENLKIQFDPGQADERLQELQGQQQELDKYIKRLQDIVKDEKDPKRIKWKELAEQARLLESQADYDQAIEKYETVLAQGADDPKVRERLDELKRDWEIKGDEHKKARHFIYDTWPKLERAEDIKSKLAKAREALDACKTAGDRLSPKKLLNVCITHTARLGKEVESLRADNDDDQKTLEIIKEVSNQLKSLVQDVTEYLQKSK